MKTSLKYSMLCSALLVVGQCVALSAEETTDASGAPMSRQKTVLATVTASVEAIDLTNREVTLKGPLGNTVTFTVDQRVKRLNEVKVGDFVRADYYVSIAAELREPTAEEKEHPLEIVQAAAKAPPGTSPAAGGLRRFKVVTTIEGLDRPTQTVTVKGPRGNYLTARVEDPSRLTKMRIGDNIVVTYTEALAISLEKAEKKSTE
jgi:Cu/Ag efflux protein CusF